MMTKRIHMHQDQSHDHTRPEQFTDQVCGMSAEDAATFNRHEYNDVDYYFCSDHCLEKFKDNPGHYETGETKKCRHGVHGEKEDIPTPVAVHSNSGEPIPVQKQEGDRVVGATVNTNGALGISLSPIIAAAAMSLSSVSVIGNALRLKSFKTM